MLHSRIVTDSLSADAISLLLLAYVGPGAGFTFLGSFLALLLAALLGLCSLLAMPFQIVLRWLRRQGHVHAAAVDQVVLLVLDGLIPNRLEEMLKDDGRLPNCKKLAELGMFRRLTDGNAADLWQGGNEPFWHLLGNAGIPCTVLRAPGTFPVQPYRGRLLAGYGVPDLLGTPGSCTFYESDAVSPVSDDDRCRCIAVSIQDRTVSSQLPGPSVSGRTLSAHWRLRLDGNGGRGRLRIGSENVVLTEGVYSDWIRVRFRHRLNRFCGICRFLLVSTHPFRLYVTPINIDPEHPQIRISHPGYYASYLAKLNGLFATLGPSANTTAQRERTIGPASATAEAILALDEQIRIFLTALDRSRAGFCCCAFDIPANENAYLRVDRLVGSAMARLKQRALLMAVASPRNGNGTAENDHGAGILLCSVPLRGDRAPRAVDLAPTVLNLFGIAIPDNMAGEPLQLVLS